MSAASVRAGKAFVEISANDTDFQRGMKRVQHSVVRLGGMMRQVGSGMMIAGGAMGLPMLLAARQAATFEDALLELKGAAGELSFDQLDRVRKKALQMSRDMGVAPSKVAQAFALLVKAGMSVEDAINGGAKSAIEFSQVSGVDATQAAEFMSDAMNVFGASASQAADTLSAAADSSSTSIASMVESFGLVASVAKGSGQSLFGLAQGMAALAPYGIKGEEAGTGIKTVLLKLISPAKDAQDALKQLGIGMGDLYDQRGKLIPLAQIAEVFSQAMGRMGKDAFGEILGRKSLVDVFDVRGVRVIEAFADLGKKGFSDIADRMERSRSVAEKYMIAMSGITGAFIKMASAVERLSIAFMVGAVPALKAFVSVASLVLNLLSAILTQIPVISPILASVATSLAVLGAAGAAVGAVFAFLNFGLKNFINIGATMAQASRAMISIIGNLVKAFTALRVAMLALPGGGWALAALAAVSTLTAFVGNGSQQEQSGGGAGIKRDNVSATLGSKADDIFGGAGKNSREASSMGSFASAVASQMGVGPSLTSQEQTADNTERTADNTEKMVSGIDNLVRQGGGSTPTSAASENIKSRMPVIASDGTWNVPGAKVPSAKALQSGMAAPGVRGGVVARSDRDIVSSSERAAIAAEESRNYLRQLVDKAGSGGLAFA